MALATVILGWAFALGSALMAGAFFAFSSFVMPALGRLPAAQGVGAMQAINRAALTKPFLVPFVGAAAVAALLAVLSLAAWDDLRARHRFAGCVVYFVGTFVVTMTANVPRNEALARVDAGSAQAAAQWLTYLSEWTAWNHVRTAAAVAGLVLWILSR